MTLQNTKILLDKINALHKSIETDVQISGIERDLMLSYTRQFYEAFLLMGDEHTPVRTAVLPVVPIVETPKAAPQPVQVAPPVVEKVVVVPAPAPVIEPVVEKIIVPQSPVIEYTPVTPVSAPKEDEIKVVAQPIIKSIPPTVFPEPPRPKAAAKPLVKPANERVEQSELFEEKMSKELSDKLGETAIDDIKKGMTLNDRILFMRDLFMGKQEEFDTAVYALNNAGSFDAARKELSELAFKFDWASKEKQAKPFIRLVRRRYN